MKFDLIVIGAGPGGYVCAIRAAKLGLRTALIEKSPTLGGTCLNVGCIPSKALLHSTEMLHFAKNHSDAHGISIGNLSVDLPRLMKRKDDVVAKLVGGVASLCQGNGITVYHGFGKLTGDNNVQVVDDEGKTTALAARSIVLATGSVPIELPFLPFNGNTIVSSDDAIAFDSVPNSLAVIGGGAIGLELGSVWSRLGSQVTIIEFLPHIAAFLDEDISKLVSRIFKKQGMKLATETKVTGANETDGKVLLKAEKMGKPVEFVADKVLVAVGRKAYNENLGLSSAGVERDDRGRIRIDSQFRTSNPNVYAIGDTVTGPMLAHKAEEEGVAIAEMLAGKPGHVNYRTIPNVIYTDPEIASVGITEKEAREQQIEIRVGKFNMAANGRAIASDATDGIVKVIADAKSDRLLGIQLVAHGGSELIASAVAHMEYCGSAEDLGRTIHAHPTQAEAIKEAALAVSKSAIHAL